MLTPALDHLGRPTQIYVHVAVVQRARAKMIGDMAGQRVTASGARTGSVVDEVRDTRAERLDPVDLDKIGGALGLAYPAGPALERLAEGGDAARFPLPRALVGREGCDFSFSGLKTAVRQIVRQAALTPAHRADLAAAFQGALIDCLIDRTRSAMRMFRAEFGASENFRCVVAGGVAANAAIRTALNGLADGDGFGMFVPPPRLCTDNAAMVAWAGLERHQLGLHDSLDAVARPRWPLVWERR